LVLPIAALVIWLIGRLHADELAGQPRRVRIGMRSLRGAAAALIVLVFLQPSCTRPIDREELPVVRVLLDDSASMATSDPHLDASRRLDLIETLGMAVVEGRDNSAARSSDLLERLVEDLPGLRRVVALRMRGAGSPTEIASARERAKAHADALAKQTEGLIGSEDLAGRVGAVVDLLRDFVAALDEQRDVEDLRELDHSLAELLESDDLQRRLRQAQVASDASMVNGGDPVSPLGQALAAIADASRFELAAKICAERLLPFAEDGLDLRVQRLDAQLAPLDPAAVGEHSRSGLSGPTNFAKPLQALAESPDDQHLAAVVLVSDGRMTAGSDPLPIVRGLRARGVRLATVALGDDHPARDAAVAGISGSREVYRGEIIRLDVRYRIVGFPDRTWRLILSRDEEDLEEREVSGSGEWQTARFEIPADEPGIWDFQARLELIDEEDSGQALPQGLLREAWTGLEGVEVSALTGSAQFRKAPKLSETVAQFAAPKQWADNYGSRLRGWLLPPESGKYTFWITADDSAELWLSSDSSHGNKRLIAAVEEAVGDKEWERQDRQRSQAIALQAGEAYYIEALHKDGGGADHVAVGWQLPDTSIQRPIPGEHLLPWSQENELLISEGWEEYLRGGEATLQNNSARTAVAIHEDRMRVLLVDDHPRWESRYLCSLFERDRRVELVRRYRSIRLPQGAHELIPTSQEELNAYDLVVLGDLHPDELDAEDQRRLADFVRRRGGFLIVVAGPQAMPSAYSLGTLADVLPVRSRGHDEASRDQQIRLRLTDAGDRSVITSVLNDGELNRQLWPALPPLTWIARGVEAKPQAQVLLRSNEQQGVPIVAVARIGAGRVLYCGSDETWRWRDRLGDRVHQTFWLQVLRWGLSMRLRGADPQLQMACDRSLITPGDTVHVRARAILADGSPCPTTPVLRAMRSSAHGEPELHSETQLAAIDGDHGLWYSSVPDLPEGRWLLRISVDHPQLEGLVEERTVLVRKALDLETIDLSADHGFLNNLADAG